MVRGLGHRLPVFKSFRKNVCPARAPRPHRHFLEKQEVGKISLETLFPSFLGFEEKGFRSHDPTFCHQQAGLHPGKAEQRCILHLPCGDPSPLSITMGPLSQGRNEG